MDMRSGGVASVPPRGDHLAPGHLLAHFHIHSGVVGVRLYSVAVIHNHQDPVAAVPTCKGDRPSAAAFTEYQCSLRCSYRCASYPSEAQTMKRFAL